jgi:hypothetical protein
MNFPAAELEVDGIVVPDLENVRVAAQRHADDADIDVV